MFCLTRPVIALALMLAVGFTALMSVPSSADSTGIDDEVQAILAAQAALEPGGTVSESRIIYSDGRVFVAVPAETYSLSQCTAKKFCWWSLSNYNGSFTYVAGAGVMRALSGPVGSIRNRRANAARLYSNSGTSSTCYAPKAKNASMPTSYVAAPKVYLSDTTTC